MTYVVGAKLRTTMIPKGEDSCYNTGVVGAVR